MSDTGHNTLLCIGLLGLPALVVWLVLLPSLPDALATPMQWRVAAALLASALLTQALLWRRSSARLTISLLVAGAAWVLLGLAAALAITVLNGMIGALAIVLVPGTDRAGQIARLRLTALIAGVIGLGLLAAQGIALLFNAVPPLPLTDDLTPLLVHVLALMSAYVVVRLGTIWASVIAMPPMTWQQHILMIAGDMVPLALVIVLPQILTQAGEIVFYIVLAMLVLMGFYQGQFVMMRANLSRRSEETTAIRRLGDHFTTRLDLDELLQHLYMEVRGLIPATTYFVALYDDAYEMLSYPLVMRQGEPQNWPSRRLDTGCADQVIVSGQALRLSGKEMPLCTAFEGQPAAFIGLPLRAEGSLIGVLGLSHATDPDAFSKNDLLVLALIAPQAAVAIRNARLYQRTQRLAQNVGTVNAALQDVLLQIDRDDTLLMACDVARQVTQAEQAALVILDANTLDLDEEDLTPSSTPLRYRVHALGFEEHFNADDLLATRPLTQNGAPLIVPDALRPPDDLAMAAPHAADALRQVAVKAGFRAMLAVPLRSGLTPLGHLIVYHATPQHYDASTIGLLEMLATQITAAIDNVELIHALEMYAREQAQLVNLSRISTSHLDLERVIQDVAGVLAEMFDYDRAALGLVTAESESYLLYVPQSERAEPQQSSSSIIPELQQILSARHYTTGEYAVDDPNISAALRSDMQTAGDQSRLIAPLRINEVTIGFVQLAAGRRHAINGSAHHLLQLASYQVAVVVQNARVHRSTEEALVKRMDQLALLEHIALNVTRSLDQETIIHNVLEAALQSTQAEKSLLALAEGNQYRCIIHEHVHDQVIRRVAVLTRDQGVVGEVLRNGQTIVLRENADHPGYISTSTHTYASSVVTPLYQGQRIIGALSIESRQPAHFTDDQVSFIKSLAGHAAISIQNAQLLQKYREQINTLTNLRDMTLRAVTTFNQQELLRVLLQSSLRVLNGLETAIYFYHRETNGLVLVAGFRRQLSPNSDDPRGGDLYEAEPIIPDELVYAAARLGEPQLIEDIRRYPAYRERLAAGVRIEHRSLAIMPIQRRESIQEVLCVTFPQTRTFDDDFLNTLDLLALQISGHLENATLTTDMAVSNTRLRTILDTARDGIILLDRAGHIHVANPAAQMMVGIDLSQDLNEPLAEILAHELSTMESGNYDTLYQQFATRYRADSPYDTTYEYSLMHDGRELHLKEQHTPVYDENEDIIGRLLTLRDQTEEKELESYRRKLQRMVIHDLRGPLGNIISSLYVANAMIDEIPAEIDENLRLSMEVSQESAGQLLQLVDSLRDIERLGKGQLPLHKARITPRELLEKAYDALSISLREAGLKVRIVVEEGAPDLYVDEDLLRRVLINLLQNAYKFTPSGGQIILGAGRMRDDGDGMLRLFVSDSGPGIPEQTRERIFNQYEQIEGRRPLQGGRGSGLGLHFCKLAVEAHGGRIWVAERGPLPGACLTFSVPIAQPDDDSPVSVEPSGETQP